MTDRIKHACFELARQSTKPVTEVRGAGVALTKLCRSTSSDRGHAADDSVRTSGVRDGGVNMTLLPSLFQQSRKRVRAATNANTVDSGMFHVALSDAAASDRDGALPSNSQSLSHVAHTGIDPSDIDPSVLSELPPEIQAELRAQINAATRQHGAQPSVSAGRVGTAAVGSRSSRSSSGSPKKAKARRIDSFFSSSQTKGGGGTGSNKGSR
jgi:hypothetical protein